MSEAVRVHEKDRADGRRVRRSGMVRRRIKTNMS